MTARWWRLRAASRSSREASSSNRAMAAILATQHHGSGGRLTRGVGAGSTEDASSFAKSLFLGDIPEEMVFPWPQADAEEQDKVRALIAAAHEIADGLDFRKIEEDRWIGDKVIRQLGDAGLCGLYVPEKYG